MRGKVSLREGVLEELLCRKRTKEHESIISADIDARQLHAALLIAGARAGSPVQFRPEFKPPTGQKVGIWVEWNYQGKSKRVKAQDWIRNVQTKKVMSHDWVFAGSRIVQSPDTKSSYYLANDGDVISVANFVGSMLDLDVESSSSNQDILFEAFTQRIPPVDTEVFVVLQPISTGQGNAKK